jgi:LysM repeat protein
MARAQFKLLVYLVVLGLTLGSMALAYYIYTKVLSPEERLRKELSQIRRAELPRIDPGLKRFDAAGVLLKEGRFNEAREALFRIVQQFPDSAAAPEAKRIIGEINMDELFSREPVPGKRDYIVQPGDSLALIATRQNTTMDLLIRLNGLMGATLHPGDHLSILPVSFNLVVDASAKTVTLRRVAGEKEVFFKEYQATDLRLPAGVKLPAEMDIKGKSAMLDGRAVLSTDPRYAEADKWLPGSRAGVVLRTPPPPEPAPAPGPDGRPAPPPAPPPGIFLNREDLEEMFALVRNGSKLYLIR